jgi:hypothetical protein
MVIPEGGTPTSIYRDIGCLTAASHPKRGKGFAGAVSNGGDPPTSEPPPRLATETAANRKALNSPGYHEHEATARRLDALIEIENRAARRDREARAFALPAGRVRDLVRFFAFTYGEGMPDDDGGRDDAFILAQHVARLNGDPASNVARHVRQWCPWMDDDELAALVRRVQAKPIKWSADTLGKRLGLLDEVRTKLRIKTIGGCDVSKAERTARTAARKVQAKTAKRRAGGVQARDAYEANSLSRTKPWEAEGIGRSTWYARRKEGRTGAPLDRSDPCKQSCSSGGHTCPSSTRSQAAPPLARQGEGVAASVLCLADDASLISVVSWVRAAP